MKKEKKIILVTQKNSEVDDPAKNDVFTYGCESNILQLLKLDFRIPLHLLVLANP